MLKLLISINKPSVLLPLVGIISTGEPKKHYLIESVRHVLMRQGVLGVKVAIMMDYDPKGINGCKTLLSDVITILEPKGDV